MDDAKIDTLLLSSLFLPLSSCFHFESNKFATPNVCLGTCKGRFSFNSRSVSHNLYNRTACAVSTRIVRCVCVDIEGERCGQQQQLHAGDQKAELVSISVTADALQGVSLKRMGRRWLFHRPGLRAEMADISVECLFM